MAYTTIDDPSEYFQTAIYSGNSSTLAVTSQGNATIAPDWVWVKRRNSSSNHALVDSSRGRAPSLATNTNEAEYNTSATDKDLISFDTDGFTVGQPNQRDMNSNGDTFVAWQWKANGGTTASNTDGTITSTVQANTDAGFNIVTYTGTGSNATVGHGLGVVPKFVIYKRRSAVENWGAYHTATGNTGCCFLNLTIAKSTSSSYFNNTSPTSTTLSFGTNPAFNGNGSTHVAYCFAEIQGYSKIGSYKGNGNANGTFVYTGFKPAWVLVKSSSLSQSWQLSDSARNPSNVVNRRLAPNDTSAESTAHSWIDFTSNGFKLRINDPAYNSSGASYIYIAFAEHPFVSSEGVPTTAR